MKTYIYPLLALFAMALGSCNHKDLYYLEIDKNLIVLEYDWRDAPDANPAGMCAFFYSEEKPGTYYRFDFDNRQGGEIEIPAGRYKLITYNNDTEKARFSETDDFDNHIAYTRDGDLLEPLFGNGVSSTAQTSDGERVCITPDGLWGCHAADVVIDKSGVTYTLIDYNGSRANTTDDAVNTRKITLYPHDMLCHYTYEVRNVENVKYLSKISGALSGMSPSLNVSDESCSSDHVTLPVSGKVDAAGNRVTGEFLTFGRSAGANVPHKMTFFVVMSDGSKYRIDGKDNLDVTSQVDKAPDRRHVHIIIDGLKLPAPGVEDDNWDLTVDDWGVLKEDIII